MIRMHNIYPFFTKVKYKKLNLAIKIKKSETTYFRETGRFNFQISKLLRAEISKFCFNLFQ